jgi:hypothetical protein
MPLYNPKRQAILPRKYRSKWKGESIMKLQKTQDTGERKPRTVMLNQAGATTPISKPVPHAQPSFDDLHAHIATRAYELYIQRGCREGCAMDDWLDAEREIVSREFPVSLGSGRGDSL